MTQNKFSVWIIDPDGRNVGSLKSEELGTVEDIEAAQLLGATTEQLFEFCLHRRLDQVGVPREGREIHLNGDRISFTMPTGWTIAG